MAGPGSDLVGIQWWQGVTEFFITLIVNYLYKVNGHCKTALTTDEHRT